MALPRRVDETNDVALGRNRETFRASHCSGQLGYRGLHRDSGADAELLGELESVVLSGDCIGCDEAYPEMANVDCAMLGEDLFHCVLHGDSEIFEGNGWRSHGITSQEK
jgi:hypothetical protein